MRLAVLNIQDVAESQMCAGCGACAYISPDRIQMVDVLEHGRRPQYKEGGLNGRGGDAEAMRVCPGIGLAHTYDSRAPGLIKGLGPAWGPVLELWEGHAADWGIRFAGSSGGAASALALYCIERAGMHGVLHVAARPDVPYLNRTVFSTSREQVLAATGSRYAPASPCDGLDRIETAPAPCVFIGKPCDVAATSSARLLRPQLDRKLGLTIGIFCAGTPSTRGTLEMIEKMGMAPGDVKSVRYRGHGWPGNAAVTAEHRNGNPTRGELTYEQSWGEILQRHRQWRCHVCADHTGEFADIAVGDPWYRPIPPGEPGRSLVLVRTERGRQIVRGAMAAGYLKLEPVEPVVLVKSQPNLLRARGQLWARIWVSRLLGAAAPRYRRMPTFRFWVSQLSLKQKAQSIYGTVKRVYTKRLRQRAVMDPFRPPVREAAATGTPTRLPQSANVESSESGALE